LAFEHAELDCEKYVRTSQALVRPAEVDVLQGDAMKAHDRLGWKAEISLEQLAAEMVDADLARYRIRLRLS
jgi:GDPmannose 4,6-dehydratase